MSSFSKTSFASGLDRFSSFSALDWDVEFDELTSNAPAAETNADTDTQLTATASEVTSVDSASKPDESDLFPLDDTTSSRDQIDVSSCSAPVISQDSDSTDLVLVRSPIPVQPEPVINKLSQELIHMFEVGPVYHRRSHPGWSSESASWIEETTTSPEVSLWAASPGIVNDLKWTMDACKNELAENDIPRVASCMLRAIQHVYPVGIDSGVRYPIGALGKKNRSRSRGPERLYRRGSKGLKKPKDPEIPGGLYFPAGVKSLPPTELGKAFYPRPSRLSKMEICEYEDLAEVRDPLPAPFSSGESHLEENEEFKKVEGIFPAEENPESGIDSVVDGDMAEDLEEIDVQPYEEDSDQEENFELSFEDNIEAQFEVEINGGSLPAHIVDEDDVYFYGTSDISSRSSTPQLIEDTDNTTYDSFGDEVVTPESGSDDFMLSDEKDEFSATCYPHIKLVTDDEEDIQALTDDYCDHSELSLHPNPKIPEIPCGYVWSVHSGIYLIVRSSSGYDSENSDDEDSDSLSEDDFTGCSGSRCEDIDSELALLDSMSVESDPELRLPESEDRELHTTITGVAQPSSVEGAAASAIEVGEPGEDIFCPIALPDEQTLDNVQQLARGSVRGFEVVFGAVSTIYSLISANPVSVCLW